jgi:hypothetical protein
VGFKFNPFTGNLDLVGVSSGASGTDHHSGWYDIQTGQSVTIAERKQMTTWGTLILDGTLIIDGQLISEL